MATIQQCLHTEFFFVSYSLLRPHEAQQNVKHEANKIHLNEYAGNKSQHKYIQFSLSWELKIEKRKKKQKMAKERENLNLGILKQSALCLLRFSIFVKRKPFKVHSYAIKITVNRFKETPNCN